MSLERGGGSRDGSEGSVGDARAEGEVEGGGGGVAREHGRAAERDGAVGGGRRMEREAHLSAGQREGKGKKYEE